MVMGPNDFVHFLETCDYVLKPVLSLLLEPWVKSPYSWPIPTSSFFEKEGTAQQWFKHQTIQKFQNKWFKIAIQSVIKSVQTCKSHLQHFRQLTMENFISDNQWPTFLNKNAIYACKFGNGHGHNANSNGGWTWKWHHQLVQYDLIVSTRQPWGKIGYVVVKLKKWYMIFNMIEISLKGIDNFIEVGVIMMHQNAIGMIMLVLLGCHCMVVKTRVVIQHMS